MVAVVGSNIVKDGLVFMHDFANRKKSWLGKPTTNIAYENGVKNWTAGSLTTPVSESVIIPNERYRLTSTTGGGFMRMRFDLSKLTNASTYNLSYNYKILSGGPLFYMADWSDTVLLSSTTTHYNGYSFASASGSRSTYSSTYRFMDFRISDNTVVEYWNFQLEENTFATPYTKNPRTASNAAIDLLGNSTMTITDLDYESDASTRFGVGDKITVTDPGLSSSEVTVAAWVKVDTHGNYNRLVNNSWVGNGWLLFSSATQWMFGVGQSNSQATDAIFHNSSTDWTHLVGTYDGSNVTLYVNGISSGSPNSTHSGATLTTGSNIEIGDSALNQGEIDIGITQLYNRALSPSEVYQLYRAHKPRYA